MRWARLLALGLALACGPMAGASGQAWISTKIGPFAVYSEANAKETRECAAELEQFRFSLGELLGRRDLTIRPPLELFIVRQPPPDSGPLTTRTGAIALLQGAGSLTPAVRRNVARILLEQNVGRMPPSLEQGLETFLSTTELRGAKVTWGAPPPADQRDANWALVDWLITNPETYGNVRVLLANLENNVDEAVAYQNAVHKTPAEVQREVQAYVASARFQTIDGPSRALSPERDLSLRPVGSDEINLRLADLLNGGSQVRYLAMLNQGIHQAEAEEGLGMLASRGKDAAAAAEYFRKALDDGSKNAVALIEYARLEPNPAKARDALETAVAVDPDSAEAHFLYGQKLSGERKQIEQWRAATRLAPRVQEYWVALAKALQFDQQWSEAAKAWRGAEQAAATPAEREKMIEARLAIEGQRLDFEEAEKKREEEAREADINRLKKQAIAEIRAAEAKVNANSSAVDTTNAVAWDQLDAAGPHVEGQIVRIECTGRAMRLILRTGDGKLFKLDADPSKLAVTDPRGATLACGPQKERPVSVVYSAKRNVRTGVAGDAISVEFR